MGWTTPFVVAVLLWVATVALVAWIAVARFKAPVRRRYADVWLSRHVYQNVRRDVIQWWKTEVSAVVVLGGFIGWLLADDPLDAIVKSLQWGLSVAGAWLLLLLVRHSVSAPGQMHADLRRRIVKHSARRVAVEAERDAAALQSAPAIDAAAYFANFGLTGIPKEPEQPPSVTTRLFDGARAGIEVTNSGGACKLKARVQLLSCAGPKALVKHKDRHPAHWDRRGGAVIKLGHGDDDKIIVAKYESRSNFSHSWLEISILKDGTEALQYWMFDKSDRPERVPISSAVVLVEIESDPAAVSENIKLLLEFDHGTRLITMSPIVGD